MEPIEGIGIIVVTAILMTMAMARSARRIQGHVLGAARLVTQALARPSLTLREGQSYDVPGLGAVTRVRVRPGSFAAKRAFGDLDLHRNTGAVVVAIERGGNVIVPDDESVLQEGDVLEIAGPSDAVAAAKQLLNQLGQGEARELAVSV